MIGQQVVEMQAEKIRHRQLQMLKRGERRAIPLYDRGKDERYHCIRGRVEQAVGWTDISVEGLPELGLDRLRGPHSQLG